METQAGNTNGPAAAVITDPAVPGDLTGWARRVVPALFALFARRPRADREVILSAVTAVSLQLADLHRLLVEQESTSAARQRPRDRRQSMAVR